MKERVQIYYDSAVDVKVHDLIQTFESIGQGKRGYTNNKLKECLKVYQVLAERCGTSEPMDVLIHYIDGLDTQGMNREESNVFISQKDEEAAEKKEVSSEVDDSVVGLLGDSDDFEFGDDI